jgi:hypothetical protein
MRAPVVAGFGRHRLAGARLSVGLRRGPGIVEKEKSEGISVTVSEIGE